jgi:acylphosphatase
MLIARHIFVTGRVQGVYFRGWTKEQAEALGIAGWVRNAADGSVEAWIEGEAAAVEILLKKLRDGPPAANVAGVRTEVVEAGQLNGFEVRR